MKILHISDTHNFHRQLQNLPEADVLVHSGDFTTSGAETEALDFLEWICDLPFSHKIFICGNHDECLYGAHIEGLDSNVHYLCNSGIEIEGVNFYGVPMFMADCYSNQQSLNFANIPATTDILITHSPPFGILDLDNNINYGSEDLLTIISTLNIKAHLFGHIHANSGITHIGDVIFSNGAIISPDDVIHKSPNIITIE